MADSAGKEKAPGEMFCRSCGETIKKEAEICPHCGVRNKNASSGATRTAQSNSNASVQHDPGNYETTVSESWYKAIAASLGLWVFYIILSSVVQPSGGLSIVLGLVVLGAWATMPIAVYFDAQYVRANSKWNPTTVVWVIAMALWFVNIIAGAVYLHRRHKTLGEP